MSYIGGTINRKCFRNAEKKEFAAERAVLLTKQNSGNIALRRE